MEVVNYLHETKSERVGKFAARVVDKGWALLAPPSEPGGKLRNFWAKAYSVRQIVEIH